MRVLVTGATGLVGRALSLALLRQGHDLIVLTRSTEDLPTRFPYPAQIYQWQPTRELPPKDSLKDLDAVIHLAGESIATGRWTTAQKQKISQSRALSTRHLVHALATISGKKPSVFISASATGRYGDRGEDELSENSAMPPSDFLSQVCTDWEDEAQQLQLFFPQRTVILRVGVVLARHGGFCHKLAPLIDTGLAGPLGSGRQWMSWIHVQDLVCLILFCLENHNIHGAVNAVSPQPIRHGDLLRVFGQILGRPTLMPVPALALKLALGEAAALALGSQRVYPKNALANGFDFKHTDLTSAFHDLYGDQPWQQEEIFEQWLALPPALTEKFLNTNYPPAKNCTRKTEELKNGTLIREIVKYQVPMGFVGRKFCSARIVRKLRNFYTTQQAKVEEYLTD